MRPTAPTSRHVQLATGLDYHLLGDALGTRLDHQDRVGGPGDDGPLGTRVIAEAAKRRNVPVIVDAAAEILTVNPNVHLQRGATAPRPVVRR